MQSRINLTKWLAVLLAIIVLMQPDAAQAGWGRMFCGWAGLYNSHPMIKIIFTILFVLILVKSVMGSISGWAIFFVSAPIVIFALAPAILYGLSGEDCSVPEDVPHSMSTPVTQGASQGSAAPVIEQQSQPAGSGLNVPQAGPHGSSIPLPMLQKQLEEQKQEDTGNSPPPPASLNNIPQERSHGSSVPLPMLGQ